MCNLFKLSISIIYKYQKDKELWKYVEFKKYWIATKNQFFLSCSQNRIFRDSFFEMLMRIARKRPNALAVQDSFLESLPCLRKSSQFAACFLCGEQNAAAFKPLRAHLEDTRCVQQRAQQSSVDLSETGTRLIEIDSTLLTELNESLQRLQRLARSEGLELLSPRRFRCVAF